MAKSLKVVIKTDSHPEETTWRVTNTETGDVILEGGPYEEANHKYETALEIVEDGCYNLTVYDAGGDGIAGTGYYSLKTNTQTVISGGGFTDSDSNEFVYEVYASAEEQDDLKIGVYINSKSDSIPM